MEELINFIKNKGKLTDTQIEDAICEWLDANEISYEYNEDFSDIIKLIEK